MTHEKMKVSKKISLVFLVVFMIFSIVAFTGIAIAHSMIFGRYDYAQYDVKKYITYNDVAEQYPREEIAVKSGENMLKAYIYGAQNTLGLIIISPGHTDPNDIKLYEIMYFVDSGWKVIGYDYTGCYTSKGDEMHGYTQTVHDLDSILQFVEQDDDFMNVPVMLFGHSMGAYASSAVLQYNHNIAGVVAASGFDTPREQWEYSIKRYTEPFHWLLKPYTNLFISYKYGDEASLSAIDGINLTNIPILIISGTKDEFYGGMSPLYEKRNEITNPNCEFKLMDMEGHNGHYDYFLTDQSTLYQNKISKNLYNGEINKMLYMEHNLDFMACLNQFYLDALSTYE